MCKNPSLKHAQLQNLEHGEIRATRILNNCKSVPLQQMLLLKSGNMQL